MLLLEIQDLGRWQDILRLTINVYQMYLNKGRSDEIKSTVEQFFKSEIVSRQLPLVKRVKKGEPMFLLECTNTRAYKKFHSTYPSVKIGFISFLKCKPPNVRQMKAAERIFCVCVKCENVKLKLDVLNTFLRSHRIESVKRMKDIAELSNLTLCAFDKIAMKKCVDRKCENCGTEKLIQFYDGVLKTHEKSMVEYDLWKREKIIRKTKSGNKVVTVLLSYLCFRVLTGLHKKITIAFLPVGHTKFFPDMGFGLFKRKFRVSEISTAADISKCVEDSSPGSHMLIPQLVGNENGETFVKVSNQKIIN